jgi:hypothetical protein
MGPVSGTVVFHVEMNMETANFCVAATDLWKDGVALSDKIPLVITTPVQIEPEFAHEIDNGCDNLLGWTNAPEPAINGLPATGTESSLFESPQAGCFCENVAVTVQWDQGSPELPSGTYYGFVKLVAEMEGMLTEAVARVYVTVVPNIVVTPTIVVEASQAVVDLGSLPPGQVSGEVTFSIQADLQELQLCVVATDLWKADIPFDPVNWKFGLVTSMPAEVCCEIANEYRTWEGIWLLDDNRLGNWTEAEPIEGLPAQKTETGWFESAQCGVFAQDVQVTVQWNQSDPGMQTGEYSGYVKLVASHPNWGLSDEAWVRVCVNVIGNQPPVVTNIVANPNVLWPANHKMVEVTVAVDATDDSGQTPISRIVNVTCNEPVNGPGDGSTEPDWWIADDLTVMLRAERSGSEEGRIYTIHLECTDASGNATIATADVTVPHDRGKKK